MPDTGCSSLGFAKSVRLYRQILRIGEILPAATSPRYVRPRNPPGSQAPLRSSTIETPPSEMLAELASAAPPMPGGEYLNADVLAALWEEIDAACRTERADAKQTLQEFLKGRNPAWHLVGRVHFNLAENRSDEEAPFAFIATYTTRLSAQSRAQHLPLAEALREYAGAKNKARLLSLLKPVQEAARDCAWLTAMVESGELYHPLRWSAAEAFQFLTDVPKLEAAGIVVRAPSAWASGRPPRPEGPGEHRRPGAVGPRQGCAARLSGGADARRGATHGSRNPRPAQGVRRTAISARTLGRGGSGEARRNSSRDSARLKRQRPPADCRSPMPCGWWPASR